MSYSSIDPLIEFDPCPIETYEGLKVVRDVENFLIEEAKPQPHLLKRLGSAGLRAIAWTMHGLGHIPPPIYPEK